MNRVRYGGAAGALVALAGLVACAIGGAQGVFPAWLAVCAAWVGWPLGSMALVLVHALTGGRWGDVLHPALRAGIATLPLGLPALAGVMVGARSLYPWLQPDRAGLLANGFYLNGPAALLRVGVYVIAWGALGTVCLRGRAVARVAPAGLIVLAFTSGFAAIDLTESLDPRFSSSAYGLVASAAAVLLAFAMAVVVEGAHGRPADLRDLSRLLLGLTVFWAYLDFMQFLIIWQSNLPVEAAWYAPRLRGGWGIVAAGIVGLHFVLPFVLLVSPSLQGRRPVVMAVAVLLVATEGVRAAWLVLPTWPGMLPLGPLLLSVAFFVGGSIFMVLRPDVETVRAPGKRAGTGAHV